MRRAGLSASAEHLVILITRMHVMHYAVLEAIRAVYGIWQI